jgi:hypothetical protein
MAARREPVHELEEKISGLMELTGFKCNFQGFCKAAKIDRQGLRACQEDNGTRGLNGEYQKALAAFVGFRLDWPEWVEPDRARIHANQRRDTAKAFLERCMRELNRPQRTKQPEGKGRFDVPLKWRHDGNNPRVPDDVLASLELVADTPDPGECRLRAVLICQPTPIEWGKIAIKNGKLKFSRTEVSVADIGERSADVQGLEVQNLDGVIITLKRVGTSQDRTYFVEANGAHIGEVRFQADFWRVSPLAPNDVIEMSFSVFIGDLAYSRQSQSFMRPDGKPLGKMKQTILERLQLKELTTDRNGWVELCGDALRFDEDSNRYAGKQ